MGLLRELFGEVLVPPVVHREVAEAVGRAGAAEVSIAMWVGSAGLLVLAKRAGLVPAVRPLLDELLSAGLYLDDAIHRLVLGSAGEA